MGSPRVPASRPATCAANFALALSSTASSSRSRFATNPFSSISSFSSRAFSSLPSGSRFSAARSIGGIAIVVRIAMVTIIENRFWLSTPIDRPMVAMMTSVDPRAFMPLASAKDSLRLKPAEAAADERAAEFSDARDQHQRAGEQQQVRVFQDREVGAEPGEAEEHRHEQAVINPRSRSSICLVRIGDSPTSTPATKAPSTVCTPIRCVTSAIPHIRSRITVITAAELTR